MALSKTFIKDNGIVTSYHKVTNLSIADRNNEDDTLNLNVELTSYMNQEYRKQNQPIETLYYFFNITSEEEEATSARKLAYAKIKELPEWIDAENC